MLPLQEMPSEFSLTGVQAPFSLQDLKLIKGDVGKFSDGPDKYINALQILTQAFELSWKNIVLRLNQTLLALKNKLPSKQPKSLGTINI